MKQRKSKALSLDAAQFKFVEDDTGLKFEGYASVFGGIDSYGDQVEPGAYAKTLENRARPILLRWQHYGPVIGKFLEMFEDDRGLYVKGELTPGHSVAEDTAASLKHGSVAGLSIGYFVKSSRQEGEVKVLEEIELIEISIVEQPADTAAQISDLKDVEASIRRDYGFTRSDATAIVASVKAATQRDSVEQKERDEALNILNSAFT